jgi:GTPase involved in cell partitioning and DNA repair
VDYHTVRTLVLCGVDSRVFVADCQWERLRENVERFRNLKENLRQYEPNLAELPYVIQLKKRDFATIPPVEYLEYLCTRRKHLEQEWRA